MMGALSVGDASFGKLVNGLRNNTNIRWGGAG